MENREFFYDCDGTSLHMKLDFPAEEAAKYPTVILVHGLTGHMEERHIVLETHALNERGYAVLRVELYGHGKSGGRFYDHTVMIWVHELMRVIDYARSLDFASELYLTGHSQGGLTALLAAALKEDQLKGVILQSPATLIRYASLQGDILENQFDPYHVPDELQIGDRPVSGNYFRVAQLFPLDESAARLRGPVQIIHGDADEAVPYHYAVELAAKLPQAEFVTIPGEDHVYSRHVDLVIGAMLDFLDRNGGRG